jgi:chromosome partitioning protein
MNQKGGVGKTTTCITMSAILASDHKQRVLLVDADSQCNATEFFGCDPALGNLAEVLRHEDGSLLAMVNIQESNFEGVTLLAGDESLMDLDLTKVELQNVRATVLKEMVTMLTESNAYDYCIVDCPPAFNAASAAALLAADEVIIPIKLDAFSLRGMVNLMRQISNMRQINPSLHVSGCLPTMWYKSEVIEEAERALRHSGIPVYQQTIRRTDKVDEMTFAQDPLTVFSPRSAAGVDYRRFVSEFLNGGASNG